MRQCSDEIRARENCLVSLWAGGLASSSKRVGFLPAIEAEILPWKVVLFVSANFGGSFPGSTPGKLMRFLAPVGVLVGSGTASPLVYQLMMTGYEK